jgi:hypothetical protein
VCVCVCVCVCVYIFIYLFIYLFIYVFSKPAEVISRCMHIPAGRLLKCGVFVLGRFGMLVKGEEASAGSALTPGIRSALWCTSVHPSGCTQITTRGKEI